VLYFISILTAVYQRHGLDINNIHHIWLLRHLFPPRINQQLAFFAELWNQHHIQIRNGPNHSPADMFGFDMLVHGICGDQLPENCLTEDELEVYSVDWEGLHDEQLLHSQRANNAAAEGWNSWVGQIGPPENLNTVRVDPPVGSLQLHEVEMLDEILQPWAQSSLEDAEIIYLWTQALAYLQTYNNIF
jgi:hypothetical protein